MNNLLRGYLPFRQWGYEKNLCAIFSKFLFSLDDSSLFLSEILTFKKERIALNRKKSIFKRDYANMDKHALCNV